MNAFFYHWHRKNNERGFILPLTLILTFLLFSFLLHEIKVYKTEQQFVHHQENMLVLDRLLQRSAADMEKMPLADWPEQSFAYQNGEVVYMEDELPDNTGLDADQIIYFELTAKVDQRDDNARHISYVYYDKKKEKIVRWVER